MFSVNVAHFVMPILLSQQVQTGGERGREEIAPFQQFIHSPLRGHRVEVEDDPAPPELRGLKYLSDHLLAADVRKIACEERSDA